MKYNKVSFRSNRLHNTTLVSSQHWLPNYFAWELFSITNILDITLESRMGY